MLLSKLFLPYRGWKMVTCYIPYSNPMPIIRWYKKLLTDDTPTLIPSTYVMWSSTLNITGDAGSGIYVCEAANIYGQSRSEMILSVGSKPANNADTGKSPSLYISLSAGFGTILLLMCVIRLILHCR